MTPFVPSRLPPQDGAVKKERRHRVNSKEFTDHCSIHFNEKSREVHRNK